MRWSLAFRLPLMSSRYATTRIQYCARSIGTRKRANSASVTISLPEAKDTVGMLSGSVQVWSDYTALGPISIFFLTLPSFPWVSEVLQISSQTGTIDLTYNIHGTLRHILWEIENLFSYFSAAGWMKMDSVPKTFEQIQTECNGIYKLKMILLYSRLEHLSIRTSMSGIHNQSCRTGIWCSEIRQR